MYFKTLLAVCSILFSINVANGDVTITNRTGQKAYVATCEYDNGNKGGGNGASVLAYVAKKGWRFTGWKVIQPSGKIRLSNGSYHIASGPKAFEFNGKSHLGVIKAASFTGFVEKGNENRDVAKLCRELGFKQATYYEFANTKVTLSAPKTVRVRFNNRSGRDIQYCIAKPSGSETLMIDGWFKVRAGQSIERTMDKDFYIHSAGWVAPRDTQEFKLYAHPQQQFKVEESIVGGGLSIKLIGGVTPTTHHFGHASYSFAERNGFVRSRFFRFYDRDHDGVIYINF